MADEHAPVLPSNCMSHLGSCLFERGDCDGWCQRCPFGTGALACAGVDSADKAGPRRVNDRPHGKQEGGS